MDSSAVLGSVRSKVKTGANVVKKVEAFTSTTPCRILFGLRLFWCEQGAESLRPLLDQARDYVPRSHWSTTPLALKATAGLRLLSEETAQQLLGEVGIHS